MATATNTIQKEQTPATNAQHHPAEQETVTEQEHAEHTMTTKNTTAAHATTAVTATLHATLFQTDKTPLETVQEEQYKTVIREEKQSYAETKTRQETVMEAEAADGIPAWIAVHTKQMEQQCHVAAQ